MNDQYSGYYSRLAKAAAHIAEKTMFRPDAAIVLGSGLGYLAAHADKAVELNYSEIPGFPDLVADMIPGHTGKLTAGIISGHHVILFGGRFHYYQGYDIQDVVFQIRLANLLGIHKLILTNSAGGINKTMTPGDLMIITDHLGLLCPSPLRGFNVKSYGGSPISGTNDAAGEIFNDMSEVYSRRLIKITKECADVNGIIIKMGIYAFSQGPAYETPAEIAALASMGADAVGMSTVAEAVTANSLGIETLGISCISNMAAGISPARIKHNDVLQTAEKVSGDFIRLLAAVIGQI